MKREVFDHVATHYGALQKQVGSGIYKDQSWTPEFYLGSRVDHHLSNCVAERKPFHVFTDFFR